MNIAPGAWKYAAPPLLAAPFALIIGASASALTLLIGVAVLAFFRDPDRTPPPTGVVSPADGKVSVVRREGDRIRVGVFMNVWHVHVARAPFSGTVQSVEHTPGAHRLAFSKDSDRNERVHVRLDGDREVTLIAGAFARRIHPYVDGGDAVERGERIGHIAFGSRVDVVFPPGVTVDDLAVGRGDRVTAGETILLEDVDSLVDESVGTDSIVDAAEDLDEERA